MVFAKPHFLLFCDASVSSCARSDTDPVGGRWHFVLERIDAAERLEAADGERGQPRERLALLAVVRGLEAIEQPSQVTLVTTSRYVARGLRYGLAEWRETGYIWEHFGVQKPIRNADLWQRIDGAMQFHVVACRLLESSMAQQSTSVAAEAATQLDELAVPVEEMEIARPAIPAPHFPVRPIGPSAGETPTHRVPVGVRAAARRARGVETLDELETSCDQDVWYEPDAEEEIVRPAARMASVRSVPRSHLIERNASWWQLAAGWLGWRSGRSGPRSRRLAGGWNGSLSG